MLMRSHNPNHASQLSQHLRRIAEVIEFRISAPVRQDPCARADILLA